MKVELHKVVTSIVLICLCFTVEAQVNPLPELEKFADAEFFMMRGAIFTMPEKKIVLFRSRKEICALKIARHGVQSANNSLFSEYEISRSPVEGDLAKSRIEHGKFEFQGFSRYGHLGDAKGNNSFFCGGQRIIWYYPTTYAPKSASVLIGPTAWEDFGNINMNEKNMQWFSADLKGNREERRIDLSSLPETVK